MGYLSIFTSLYYGEADAEKMIAAYDEERGGFHITMSKCEDVFGKRHDGMLKEK